MMKKTLVLIVIALFSVFNCVQAADIEARTGIMGGDVWGASCRSLYKLSAISIIFNSDRGVVAYGK